MYKKRFNALIIISMCMTIVVAVLNFLSDFLIFEKEIYPWDYFSLFIEFAMLVPLVFLLATSYKWDDLSKRTRWFILPLILYNILAIAYAFVIADPFILIPTGFFVWVICAYFKKIKRRSLKIIVWATFGVCAGWLAVDVVRRVFWYACDLQSTLEGVILPITGMCATLFVFGGLMLIALEFCVSMETAQNAIQESSLVNTLSVEEQLIYLKKQYDSGELSEDQYNMHKKEVMKNF